MSKPKNQVVDQTANVGTDPSSPAAIGTKRRSPLEQKTQVSRHTGAGPSHRGNRRDTHPQFSTGKTHTKGGKPGPKGRSTRKGGPPGESA